MRESVWPPVQQLSIGILDKLCLIDGFIPLRSHLATYSGEDFVQQTLAYNENLMQH